ncbi:MAG: peptidylprolyl isomerase [Planctomycetota bacterium]|jgi:hypothetical protein|nr:peptidylprolyl isomerase [Planctomycetota bacterium]
MFTTLFLAAAVLPQEPEPKLELVDEIVAIVNDNILTLRDVRLAAADLGGGIPSPNLMQRAFANLLSELLFREGFRMMGGDEAALDNYVADELDRRAKELGSLAAFNKHLANQGKTIEDEAKHIRTFAISLLYRQKEFGHAPAKGEGYKVKMYVSPAEMLSYYNEHIQDYKHEDRVLARILMIGPSEEHPDTLAFLAKLRSEIVAGKKDFAVQARNLSVFKPALGGSTGHFNPKTENVVGRKPLRDYLLQAESGDLSDPIQLPQGWAALVLAESVENAGVMPFSEAQLSIQGILLQEQAEAIYRDSINRLRRKCYLWGPNVGFALDSLIRDPDSEQEEEL